MPSAVGQLASNDGSRSHITLKAKWRSIDQDHTYRCRLPAIDTSRLCYARPRADGSSGRPIGWPGQTRVAVRSPGPARGIQTLASIGNPSAANGCTHPVHSLVHSVVISVSARTDISSVPVQHPALVHDMAIPTNEAAGRGRGAEEHRKTVTSHSQSPAHSRSRAGAGGNIIR